MKNLILNLSKKKIIIVLLFLIFILGILSFIASKKSPQEKKPSPSPSLSSSPSSPPQRKYFKIEEKTPEKILTEEELIQKEIKLTKELYPLVDWLPLDTENYHLTYAKPGILQVTLKKGNKEEIVKEVKEWIKSKGVDPASHEIVFK